MVRTLPISEIRRMGFETKEELSIAIKIKRNNFKTLNEIANELDFVSVKSLRCFCFSNDIEIDNKKSCVICGNEFKSPNIKAIACSDECKKEYRIRSARKKRAAEKVIVKRDCLVCNKEFQAKTKNSVYCSKTCYSKTQTDSRKIQARANGKFDDGITLYETYRKYNGICYLCGKEVDWEDKTPSYKTMVCGPNYPTMDHVVPLKDGGSHTWDNIKLACRECNCKKQATKLDDFLSKNNK